MAIVIPHRFLHRLTSTEGMEKVNTLIIGTFNPGNPDLTLLTPAERKQFEQIGTSKKFKTFSQVRNFYDRPQNRFWKIMDHAHHPEFYALNPLKTVNLQGLKYYTKLRDRDIVFERQQAFCQSRGILITDIVQSICPESFENIYDNFPDTAVERGNPVWNDEPILQVIQKHQPQKVIINFNPEGPNIPSIASKIAEIKATLPKNTLISLPSTSGAAGGTYENLVESWRVHF